MNGTVVHDLDRAVHGGQKQVPRVTASVFGGLLRALYATLRGWQERYEVRRRLAELDDHLLRDIGITRVQAAAEAAKPFWRR